jgi:hypothetical protein
MFLAVAVLGSIHRLLNWAHRRSVGRVGHAAASGLERRNSFRNDERKHVLVYETIKFDGTIFRRTKNMPFARERNDRISP